ncbi:acetyltransferase, GNAT family [Fulvivirga imtechensis AK7]|uniref:Acetyltransferase, GNAT family n=1 Tax=Fulvivirga imtechensis AK7 TaxID=1237149 RepID=L8JR26_9BACT|nr:GNAT family N-acetyltransferase [Fulvivirga imtechensis]ELR70658.1 acetyltransferase, GNAT family [Fulvivirga imtechensis AK7]
MINYVIETDRLGLRNWQDSDLPPFSKMNQDHEVMKYFPGVTSKQESKAFIIRMQEHFSQHGFCYFAVDRLDTGQFIGFTGLLHQNFTGLFPPFVDMGWRIRKEDWYNGFATEAAKACLEYALAKPDLEEVYAIAPKVNKPSQKVMKKIGMTLKEEFNHPKLKGYPMLERCVLYWTGKPR